MDVSRPYGVISHPLDSAVLVVLAGTTRPLTGHEVARLAPQGTQQGIWKALNRLVDQGLVEREEAGSSALYKLNRDHLAAPAVEILAAIRTELVDRLRREIQDWKRPPVHVSIFGSTARRDGDTESDIDLFVVRPDEVDDEDPAWLGQLDELADRIHRWTGNRASISQLSEKEVKRLSHERPPVVNELRSDAITLVGAEPSKLFRRAR